MPVFGQPSHRHSLGLLQNLWAGGQSGDRPGIATCLCPVCQLCLRWSVHSAIFYLKLLFCQFSEKEMKCSLSCLGQLQELRSVSLPHTSCLSSIHPQEYLLRTGDRPGLALGTGTTVNYTALLPAPGECNHFLSSCGTVNLPTMPAEKE